MSTSDDRRDERARQDVDPVLLLAPPAEMGVLHHRRAHRRHLAATMLDLAARGHLRIIDAGNDPTLGYALDWYLQLPDEQVPTGIDATDPLAVLDARPTPSAPSAPSAHGARRPADVTALRPHEDAFLALVAATPSRLLSRVRAAAAVAEVLDAVTADAVARGWLRRWPRMVVRTRAGTAVAGRLGVARVDLDAHAPDPQTTARLLPQAVALGLADLWTARLGRQRPEPPAWFTPGAHRSARGWFGACNAAAAMAASPPPGGGAGSASYSATNGTAGFQG